MNEGATKQSYRSAIYNYAVLIHCDPENGSGEYAWP